MLETVLLIAPLTPTLVGSFSVETPALVTSWDPGDAAVLNSSGLPWYGSLSSVGDGVLESSKQPAKFHTPRPGSTLFLSPSGEQMESCVDLG